MKIATVICIIFITIERFSDGSCPLDLIIPSQNITEMSGKWHEYKKTKGFLTNNVCTTYNVICPNDDACNVSLFPNGTNTGYTNTLITNGTYTMWGKHTIYLYVKSTNPYAVLWRCDKKTKSYELAVLVRELSDNETIKIINVVLKTITSTYNLQLKDIDNTLCSSANKGTVHLTVIALLVFRVIIEIRNS